MPALCDCGIIARRRCENCSRPVCESCDIGYHHAGAGCVYCTSACRVCGERPKHASEPLFRCYQCQTLVHSRCADPHTRTVITHVDGHGFPDQWDERQWRCKACAADHAEEEAAQEAERLRRNPTPRIFADAMRAAGRPGAIVSRVATGEAFSDLAGELRCWPVGKTKESAPTHRGYEDVSWFVAEDGQVYELSLATEHKRFGKTVHVQALVRPKSGRYGIKELGSVLFALAERHGVRL